MIMIRSRRIFFIRIAALAVYLVCIPRPAQAQAQGVKSFDSKVSYDIYLKTSDDSVGVITDVDILRFDEIGGRTFLVIEEADFSLNQYSGFILFENVVAILPNRRIKIKKSANSRLRFD